MCFHRRALIQFVFFDQNYPYGRSNIKFIEKYPHNDKKKHDLECDMHLLNHNINLWLPIQLWKLRHIDFDSLTLSLSLQASSWRVLISFTIHQYLTRILSMAVSAFGSDTEDFLIPKCPHWDRTSDSIKQGPSLQWMTGRQHGIWHINQDMSLCDDSEATTMAV